MKFKSKISGSVIDIIDPEIIEVYEKDKEHWKKFKAM